MILNLNIDLQRTIMVILSKSSDGPAEVARVMLTCKAFTNLAKDSDVLIALNWTNLKLDGRVRLFHHINGLLSRSAEVGNETAEYLMSKAVLWGSAPLWSRMLENDNLQASIRNLNGYTPAAKKNITNYFKEEAIRQLARVSNVFDGNLHHARLVRLFLSRCSFFDIVVMRYYVEIYVKHFAGSEVAFHSGFFDRMEELSAYGAMMDMKERAGRSILEDITRESESSEAMPTLSLLIPPSEEKVFDSLKGQLISTFDRLISQGPLPDHSDSSEGTLCFLWSEENLLLDRAWCTMSEYLRGFEYL